MNQPAAGGVYLRALEEDDLERTCAWHNSRELYTSLAGTFRFVSRAAELEWLRKQQAYSTNQVSLAICRRDTSEHIGNIYLRDVDWVARHAELHLFIGDPRQRGHGYGKTAVQLAVRHAFDDLGLARVFLLVLADNAPAVKLYAGCGFEVEGTLRKHAFKHGTWQDVLIMGLLREV